MELVLTHHTETQINISCDGQPSHIFDLGLPLLKDENDLINDPIGYGQKLYAALFPADTLAQRTLTTLLDTPPGYLLIVAVDSDLDAIPWEYAYGPDGFLVLQCHFVRGLPLDQRINPPLLDSGLHIVAVPSNPLSQALDPLDIDAEWVRLKEISQQVPYAVTLERTRPPTIEQVRTLVANQYHRVIHFMGHGGQDERGALLYFEQDNGELDAVTARQFVLRVRGTVFLVTLNACVSATPGPSEFSNLAAALVRQKTPYVLGMRLSISDDDARAFSRVFYNDLARGSSVEDALFQARLTLDSSSRPWVVGVPVLYTALTRPASGFARIAGTSTIKEYQPLIETSVLPRAEGGLQGRINELKLLGNSLTGDNRARLVTIHGTGGEGKTALAREAVERFAYAWPGGVWATTLENLPGREAFVAAFARFLGIAHQSMHDPAEVERLVLARLAQQRTLVVLDNAETLVNAVEANNAEAIRLAQFVREQLMGPTVSLLVTSRSYLGWSKEVSCELVGLAPAAGYRLFQYSAAHRAQEVDQALAWDLSQKVDGHPLSLRLLGSTFNISPLSLSAFVKEYEAQLVQAENKYVQVDSRQRTLYTSIDTSVRYLDTDLRTLLSGLWIFHASFLPEVVTAIFASGGQAVSPSSTNDHLEMLRQRGLLTSEITSMHDEAVLLYRLPATTRPYVEHELDQVYQPDTILMKFGTVYASLADSLQRDLHRSAISVLVVQRVREDLERGVSYVTGIPQGLYLLNLAWLLQRLGDTRQGLKLAEQALEIAQGQNKLLEMRILHFMAMIFLDTGQPQQSIALSEKTLPFMHERNDRAGEAATLHNLAEGYRYIGQLPRALDLYNQALAISRELHDKAGEAKTLTNMAHVYDLSRQSRKALELWEQALPLIREVGERTVEATILTNMAQVYRGTDQGTRALELYKQALTLAREMGNRLTEATTLASIAMLYQDKKQMQLALDYYEQALLIMHETGNRAAEVPTLVNKASVYRDMGQIQQALAIYEQALPLARAIADHRTEASTLTLMARLCSDEGQLQRALALYGQALNVAREIADQETEANTLMNMASLYTTMQQHQQALDMYEQALGLMRLMKHTDNEVLALANMAGISLILDQPQKALELYTQVLPSARKIGNREVEAVALARMADIYHNKGQLQRALQLYEQALPLRRALHSIDGEESALFNMAQIYASLGQPQQALDFYQQALLLQRKLGNHASEANTLTSMAFEYKTTGNLQKAVEFHEQALPLMKEIGDYPAASATLVSIALMLYQSLKRPQEAIARMEQAITVLVEKSLPQNTVGQTADDLRRFLASMRRGEPVNLGPARRPSLPAARVQLIIDSTVTVMTTMPDHLAGWRAVMAEALRDVQQQGADRQEEVDLFTAILAILDGQSPTLSPDHTYASVVTSIQENIAERKVPQDDISADSYPFDAELLPRSVVALLGGPQEKMAHAQYLATQLAATSDEGLKDFIHAIQVALFGADLEQAGKGLQGIYRQAWHTLVSLVETGGLDPRFFQVLVRNTTRVFGSDADQRDTWHIALIKMRDDMAKLDSPQLVALLDAVIGLLDAGGNSSGLGQDLKGIYARTWQEIIGGISV